MTCATDSDEQPPALDAGDTAKRLQDIERAAGFLVKVYGDLALHQARRIEAQSKTKPFAEAVTLAVERRLAGKA